MARPRLSQEEWDRRARECGFEWLEPVASANTPALARCLDPACRYEWNARGSGYHRRSGCPKCAGILPAPLEVREAQAAAVGAVWLEKPTDSMTPRLLRCKECHHEWKAPPNGVAQGRGCLECARRARRLDAEEWRQVAEGAGLEFLTDEVSGFEKCRARCNECHHEWDVTPHNVRQGRGCPECGKARSGKTRRIDAEEWEQAAAAAGIEWLKPVEIGKSKVPARCLTCRYEWNAHPESVRGGHGCPECALRAKRLDAEEWGRAAAAVGIEWLEPVEGTRSKVRARCLNCGSEWKAPAHGVRQGTGCPACAQKGFDPAAPAYLYLIVKPDGTAKVGVAGVGKAYEKRMGKHARNGYRSVARWRLDPGEKALAIETAVVARWRGEDGLPPAASEGEDGYTETVNTALLPLAEIRARIDKLVAERKGV